MFGVRNHLLIIPASVCASVTAARITAQTPGAVALPNQHGCSQIGADYDMTWRTLVGFGRNPNVGAVLVVGLGCEGLEPDKLAEAIAADGKPVEYLVIQRLGGTLKTIAAGTEIAGRMSRRLAAQKKREMPLSSLVLGLECGGSDPTSGLAANPVIGFASAKMVDSGGSSILSETTEVIGAEHLLAERFQDPEDRRKFMEMVKRTEKRAIDLGVDLRQGQPTPGNKAGGISTIEEKSLGCMYKAGDSPFVGVLEYAEPLPPHKKGLYFMDSPGQDIDSISGMTASGAQIIAFSTGRGTPTGSPICPVVKITGNQKTYENMIDNIDINAGDLIDGRQTLAEIGQGLFDFILEVADGRLTKAESLGHQEFGIFKLAGTF